MKCTRYDQFEECVEKVKLILEECINTCERLIKESESVKEEKSDENK